MLYAKPKWKWYNNWTAFAQYGFTLSLLSLLASLFLSLVEIIKSTDAIELETSDMEGLENENIFTGLLKRNKDWYQNYTVSK